jgi:hypothetical protein
MELPNIIRDSAAAETLRAQRFTSVREVVIATYLFEPMFPVG